MWKRISVVGKLDIGIVVSAALVNIGDAKYLYSKRDFLAVARYEEVFWGSEGSTMNRFKTFSKQPEFAPISEQLSISFINTNPYINVKELSVFGTTNGSIHIGYGDELHAEVRNLTIHQNKE